MANNRKFHLDRTNLRDKKIYGDIAIYQVGDSGCEPSFKVYDHINPCNEISLVASGRGTCTVNGKKFELKTGDIHFCRINDNHSILSDDVEPLRYFYVGFDLVDNSPLKPYLDFLCEHYEMIVRDNVGLYSKFYTIFNELIGPNECSARIMKNEFENIFVCTYKAFRLKNNAAYFPQTGISNLVYNIVCYIDNNIREVDVLANISKLFGYSYNYISYLFSRKMGLSLKEYVKNKKFELAKEYLEGNIMSITDISISLNFKSIHSFSHAFKNHFGSSPSEYRIKNNKNLK